MFKEDDFVYLSLSFVIILVLTIASFVYEVAAVTQDSWFQTAIATIRWQGVIVPVTVTILVMVEFARVLARIINERRDRAKVEEGRQEGRQENNQEWMEWLSRKNAAEKDSRPFNEPSPAEKQPINT